MDGRTYTKRTNARRAGVQAGIPAERVVITVHKDDDGVRFGFADREGVTPTGALPRSSGDVPTCLVAEVAELGRRELRNGVRRPKPGGVCRAVWDWLDANPTVSAKEAKAAAADHGWNMNNVSSEYYAWRKFRQTNVQASDSIQACALDRAIAISVGCTGAA